EIACFFQVDDFLVRESLNGALHLTREECRSQYEFLIKKGVESGTSVVLKNEHGSIIGFRLSSFIDRPKDGDKNEVEDVKFTPRADLIEDLLKKLNEGQWDRIPVEVNRIFLIIVLSVHSEYTRRGLAKILLEFEMNKMAEQGATAIIAEAAALKSQMVHFEIGIS
ncbi:hypothetical protein PFISCL1PPCAC_15060, partial [Pristionchus fissidentatus]